MIRGARPETVLENANEMGIDLSDVEDVFLSHNHWDHTGGLLTLRKELKKSNPNALKRVHVGAGIFSKRVNSDNTLLATKAALESDNVEFTVYSGQHELFPGVSVTRAHRKGYTMSEIGPEMAKLKRLRASSKTTSRKISPW